MSFDRDLESKGSSEPLMSGGSTGGEEREITLERTQHRRSSDYLRILQRLNWAVLFPWVLVSVLSTWSVIQYGQKQSGGQPLSTQLLYTPAEEAIEYEVRQFTLGFETDITEYQGAPSPEVDQKWSDLYSMGNSLISKEDAALIPNKTVIFPHDPERRYLVMLDVFHQLHCLNLIRQALHPEYYKPHNPGPSPGAEDGLLGTHHISHCLDSIRQSLMCNPDISIINWRWNEKKGENQPNGQNYHTCRRFDKIQDWARQRATYDVIDVNFREVNDPLNP